MELVRKINTVMTILRFQELFPIQPQREGSHVLVPDRPGISVEVDEHLAAQRPLEIKKPGPPLRRRDGSLTNS